MSETEKVSMNLSIVDLGQIDLLIEQGFYSGRTDFLRTAIRNQLTTHADAVQDAVTRQAMAVGVLHYGGAELENLRHRGERIDLRVVGMLLLAADVTPELARDTIATVSVRGVFRASDAVKRALTDRMR